MKSESFSTLVEVFSLDNARNGSDCLVGGALVVDLEGVLKYLGEFPVGVGRFCRYVVCTLCCRLVGRFKRCLGNSLDKQVFLLENDFN